MAKFSLAALLAICILSIGTLSLMLADTPRNSWGEVPATALGAIAAASIAGISALATSESVASRRQHEENARLKEERKRVYESAILNMHLAFAGGTAPAEEARIRSMLSVWASDDVIRKLVEWNQIVTRIHNEGQKGAGGRIAIPEELMTEIHEKLGEIALVMRSEVADDSSRNSTLDSAQISRMIFN